MSYLHIQNLYRCPQFLHQHEEVYALEKIHGTSASVSWRESRLHFFSGGEPGDPGTPTRTSDRFAGCELLAGSAAESGGGTQPSYFRDPPKGFEHVYGWEAFLEDMIEENNYMRTHPDAEPGKPTWWWAASRRDARPFRYDPFRYRIPEAVPSRLYYREQRQEEFWRTAVEAGVGLMFIALALLIVLG